MLEATFTTQVTDKGYILLPVKVRRLLKLKPKQSIQMRVKDNKIELERMLTLDEVFNFIKPSSRRFTQKELKAEEKMAHEAIARNAASEGL